MQPNRNMTVTVIVRMPWAPERFTQECSISDDACRESFAPLPKYRECMFDPESARQATRMTNMRQRLARDIAEQLTMAILKAVESRDPKAGYSPEEWATISPDY